MNVISRKLKRMARLSAKYNMEGTLLDALEINSLSMQNLETFKDLSRHPAFQFYLECLEKDRNNAQNKLNQLTLDPMKNVYQICFYRAQFEQLKRQLNFFNGILSKEQSLIDERNRIKEHAASDIV